MPKPTEDVKPAVAEPVAAPAPAAPAQITLTPGQLASEIAIGVQMAMAAAAQNAANGTTLVQSAAAPIVLCQDCGQAKKGCEGKHVKMVVYPTKYPEFGRYFRGCGINNKWYLSNNENHEILVPESCVAGILSSIHNFEENERINITGRKKEGNFSGSTKIPNSASTIGFR